MTVETLTYTYTSQAEIERLLSTAGALARVDDDLDGSAESGVWEDVVDEATDEINFHCEHLYEPSDMANNLWVRRRATLIGAYLLSQRRGDSGLYHERYQKLIEVLELVRDGKRQIPRLPTKDDYTPAMSNLRVDHRFGSRKIRVQRTTSTGGTSGRQNLDPSYLDGWYP